MGCFYNLFWNVLWASRITEACVSQFDMPAFGHLKIGGYCYLSVHSFIGPEFFWRSNKFKLQLYVNSYKILYGINGRRENTYIFTSCRQCYSWNNKFLWLHCKRYFVYDEFILGLVRTWIHVMIIFQEH